MQNVWRKRLNDYIEFSRGSPGPGLRKTTKPLRHVTGEVVAGGGDLDIDRNPQAKMVAGLEVRQQRLNRFGWVPWVVAVICTVAIAAPMIVPRISVL